MSDTTVLDLIIETISEHEKRLDEKIERFEEALEKIEKILEI